MEKRAIKHKRSDHLETIKEHKICILRKFKRLNTFYVNKWLTEFTYRNKEINGEGVPSP